ncbi:hypothetical protein G9A89_019017 [Geosiphon pyriformis]|nr:hypothetical protein G9A89_019017 [Geosiphon pyriformis]
MEPLNTRKDEAENGTLLDRGTTDVIDPDTYFETHEPPKSLEEDEKLVKEFVKRHDKVGNRVVLVTATHNIASLIFLFDVKSGGTTVPLENQTVRFIDNFSAGTRAGFFLNYHRYDTYFLEAGYAVIFMHREFSHRPYNRHYSLSSASFLDLLEEKADGSVSEKNLINVYLIRPVSAEYSLKMREAKRNGSLLLIDFFTVTDYLFLLRSVTQLMESLQQRALYYLAAAVSDFFIPSKKMVEHKIQSGGGAMTLKMDQVPKFLKPMITYWAPRGFIVSFKLETDPSLLVLKSRQALTRYGHQIVIGNLLQTRKREVVLITQTSETQIKLSDEEASNGVEIESKIVLEIIRSHDIWIRSKGDHF